MSRFNRVSSISQQEKQKIIFVTSNTISSGSSTKVFETRPGIYKLDSQFNHNVSFDTKDPVSKIAFNISGTFDNSIGFNSSVVDMCFDNDNDKTYFLGQFTTYKNISVPYLASLNYNGSINSTFTTPKNNGYGAVAGKIFIFDS
jgi:hypothetical protein